jgi:ElaB/YqjD/DUF883 family membrane-anchored ribosome-binding protein
MPGRLALPNEPSELKNPVTVATETFQSIPGTSPAEEAQSLREQVRILTERLSVLAGVKGARAAADADKFAETVDDYVYSRPYSAAAIALVAGFAVGAIWARR